MEANVQPPMSHFNLRYWALSSVRSSFEFRATNHPSSSHPSTMRRHIPKEYKDLAIHMSLNEGVSDDDIYCFIGISQRTMRQLRKTYQETGETVRIPVCPGWPHLLDTLDSLVSHLLLFYYRRWYSISQFLEGCIEQQPDMLLVELQDHLCEFCGVMASTGTIARTLHRRGYMMKMVSHSQTSWPYGLELKWRFQITRPAIEHDEVDCATFKMLVGEHFQPHQLILWMKVISTASPFGRHMRGPLVEAVHDVRISLLGAKSNSWSSHLRKLVGTHKIQVLNLARAITWRHSAFGSVGSFVHWQRIYQFCPWHAGPDAAMAFAKFCACHEQHEHP